MQGIMRKCNGALHFCLGHIICCYDTNELNKETTTEKISVVQQEGERGATQHVVLQRRCNLPMIRIESQRGMR